MLQVAVPISLQNLEIWEKRHACELVGNQKSPKRQKVFCSFADATGDRRWTYTNYIWTRSTDQRGKEYNWCGRLLDRLSRRRIDGARGQVHTHKQYFRWGSCTPLIEVWLMASDKIPFLVHLVNGWLIIPPCWRLQGCAWRRAGQWRVFPANEEVVATLPASA